MTRFQGELDSGQLWKLLFCLPQCFLNRCVHTHSFIFIMKQLTIMLSCTLLFLLSFGIGYFGYFLITLHKEISHSFSQLHSFLLFICLTEEIHHTLFD